MIIVMNMIKVVMMIGFLKNIMMNIIIQIIKMNLEKGYLKIGKMNLLKKEKKKNMKRKVKLHIQMVLNLIQIYIKI